MNSVAYNFLHLDKKNETTYCSAAQRNNLTLTCSKLPIQALEKGVKFMLKLTIKTPERRQRCFGVFIVTFEHI